MELVDRYLQAVKFWLPGEQQEDIARELSDDIASEIESAELEIGRKLDEREIEAMLKRRGRPFVVANRYLPQRQLIGPLLFPMYAFVLKVIGVTYVLPWIIVWLLLLSFAPSYHGHVARDLGTLWISVVQIFAVVTILFAAHEHHFGAAKLVDTWEPRDLPKIRHHDDRISRASSIAEIVVNLLLLAWWTSALPIAYVFADGWTSGTVWPEFHRTFFVPVILLALINLSGAAVNLANPVLTATRRALRALTNAAAAAIAGWTVVTHGADCLMELQRPAALHAPTPPPWAIATLVDAALLMALVIVAVAGTITAALEIYRASSSWAHRAAANARS